MPPWDPSSSFVQPLLSQLIASLELIAPSKSAALRDQMDRLEVVVTDEPGLAFAIEGDEDPRQLLVPIAGFEFLWAVSYAHVTIYQHAKASDGQDMEFSVHPSTQLAADVLTFAMQDRLESAPKHVWPAHLPTPSFYPLGATREPSEVELATEVFACSVAWLLHHELGHLALDHLDKWHQEPGDEAAADNAATEWLLEGVTHPVIITKCGLGMATVGIGLFALTCATRQAAALSLYPPSGKRLLTALSHPAFGDHHQAQDYACVSLKVHLDHHRIATEPGPFESTLDRLREYAATADSFELALYSGGLPDTDPA